MHSTLLRPTTPAAYGLAPVITVKATGKGKKHKPATAKLGTPRAGGFGGLHFLEQSGDAHASRHAHRVEARGVDRQRCSLTDALGREIDGNDDGQAGGDYIATVKGTQGNSGGIPVRARTQAEPVSSSTIIDTLLAHGDFAEITRSLRTRREHPLAER